MRISELVKSAHAFLTSEAARSASLAKAHAMRLEAEEENSADSPDYQFHKAAHESHLAHGELCAELAKGMMPALKATDSELAKSFGLHAGEVLLSPVSRLAPPPAGPPDGLTMVPRFGGAPAAKAVEVSEIFKTMVAVEED